MEKFLGDNNQLPRKVLVYDSNQSLRSVRF